MNSPSRLPLVLLGAYIILFVICGIGPYDRNVWWAENLPIVLLVVGIIWISRYHDFSTTSYLMMAALIYLHTIGGHFTFERVPFDWVTNLFGFERNHYDRIAHFTVGFYAFPIAEILLTRRWVNSRLILILFPVFSIISVAGIYELFEWVYAVSADPGAGNAVLGSQGDEWDAQKDILADSLGALLGIVIFWLMTRDSIQSLQPPKLNR